MSLSSPDAGESEVALGYPRNPAFAVGPGALGELTVEYTIGGPDADPDIDTGKGVDGEDVELTAAATEAGEAAPYEFGYGPRWSCRWCSFFTTLGGDCGSSSCGAGSGAALRFFICDSLFLGSFLSKTIFCSLRSGRSRRFGFCRGFWDCGRTGDCSRLGTDAICELIPELGLAARAEA